MPLNIDWQQILLHWMNLAILAGGLYFLLCKPVKQFMDKREEYYRQLDREANEKLAEAQRVKAEYQEKMEGAEEEIHQTRAKIQQAAQQSAQEQLTQAQAQAKQIVDRARTEAEHSRERALKESQRELRRLAAEATRRLALQEDPFDQFLDLAERGEDDEE
ncbi:MAG: ATP synthase F0 subunit B [Lawsonibacter sp.]|nr:ATP synthase F0 subunit B [Lawsonibacter sp.]